MKILVGLGNPGAKYAQNRHNIGFMAVDDVATYNSFGPWRKKFQGQLCEGRIGTQKAALLKPETFMNLSGQSVGEAVRFYKADVSDVFVFHDELDIGAGKLKVKQGGGHAGHNGLRSIDAHIGKDYYRIRIGIGHPGDKNAVSSYVLRDFSKADQGWLDELIDAMTREVGALLTQGTASFLTQVARRRTPEKSVKASREGNSSPHKMQVPVDPQGEKSPMEKLLDKFS